METYGKLIIVGKEGTKSMDMEFPLDKKTVLIGRDKTCDIRIVNKEISRKHAEIYQEEGNTFISSLGREPILVNGAPVHSPLQLYPSDKIEVQLEGRTRIFYFHPVEKPNITSARAPLVDANVNADLSLKEGHQPSPVKPVADPVKKEDEVPAEQSHDIIMADNAGFSMPMEEEEEEGQNNNNNKEEEEENHPHPQTTPEGTVADATYHFPLKDNADMGNNTVAVDADTTVAFGQWALGTLIRPAQEEEEEEKERINTDNDSPQVAVHPPLSSVKPQASSHVATDIPRQEQQQTPAAGILFSGFKPTPVGSNTMQGRRHTFSSVATPGTEFRPAAPAPTPATAFQADANKNSMDDHDPERLADKLHRVAAGREGNEASTPRMLQPYVMNNNNAPAVGVTPGGSQLGFKSGSAAKPPVSEARSRSATIQSAELHQHKQQEAAAAAAQPAIMVTNSAAGVEVLQPLAGFHAHVPPPTAGRSRLAMQGTTTMEEEDGDALEEESVGKRDGEAPAGQQQQQQPSLPPPLSVPSRDHDGGSRRRSSMKTPGTKIVIIERDSVVKTKTGDGEGNNNSCCAPKSLPPPPHSSNGHGYDPVNNNNVFTHRSSNNNNTNRLSRQFDEATPGSIKPLAMTSRLGDDLMQSNNKVMMSASALKDVVVDGSGVKMKSHADYEVDDKMEEEQEEEEEISLAPMAAQIQQEESPLEKMAGEVDQMMATVEKPAQYNVAGDIGQKEEETEGEQQQQHEVGMVPLAQYKSLVLKARAYRTESLQLANALHKMTAKALRLKKSANALGDALNEERKKRVEVQNVLQQIVENRCALDDDQNNNDDDMQEGDDQNEEEEMMDVDDDDDETNDNAPQEVMPTTRVIVVGRVSAPPPSTTIRAGQVVVVRPYHNMQEMAPTVAETKTPKTKAAATGSVVVAPRNPPPASAGDGGTAATERKRKSFAAASGGKRRLTTPGSVMLSSNNAIGGGGTATANKTRGTTPLKVDDVELPDWLYTEQKDPTPEISRHLQMVAAEDISPDDDNEDGEEERKRGVSPEILGSQPPLEVEKEREESDDQENQEDEDEEDMCHVCGESDEGDVLLLCDDCDNACHLGCCNPPLKRVPKGNWYCAECKAAKEEEKKQQQQGGGSKRGGGKKASASQPAAKKAAGGKRGASVVEDEAPKPKRGRGAASAATSTGAVPTRSTRSAGRR